MTYFENPERIEKKMMKAMSNDIFVSVKLESFQNFCCQLLEAYRYWSIILTRGSGSISQSSPNGTFCWQHEQASLLTGGLHRWRCYTEFYPGSAVDPGHQECHRLLRLCRKGQPPMLQTFFPELSVDGILERHFKLEFSQTRVFVWMSTLIFPSTKCYSWIDSSFLVLLIFCTDF